MKAIATLYPGRSYKQFVPQKSGLHRQAAFALYRALLSQCNIAPLGDDDKDALKNIARNRFRANRHLRVARRLKLSFYAGYKALDYLDDAVAGDTASIDRISGYLTKIPQYLKQPPKILPPSPKQDDPPYETPHEQQFFNRFPRETAEGERKVPIFVRANQFPMVRYKKPQPYQVTRTLRGLIHAKQRDIDYQQDYNDVYIPMAMQEDKWDKIISKEIGMDWDGDDDTWTRHAMAGSKVLQDLSIGRHKRTMEKAFKMVEIVEREQELADKEQAESVLV